MLQKHAEYVFGLSHRFAFLAISFASADLKRGLPYGIPRPVRIA